LVITRLVLEVTELAGAIFPDQRVKVVAIVVVSLVVLAEVVLVLGLVGVLRLVGLRQTPVAVAVVLEENKKPF
jgi:hypothetical protein